MLSIGYHPVAVWRSFKYESDNLIELFESIESSKNEWGFELYSEEVEEQLEENFGKSPN